MAGTLKRRRGLYMQPESVVRELVIQHNTNLDNIETLRAATIQAVVVAVEDLAAGADIAARACYKAPRAMTVLDTVRVIYGAASAAVDGSNTTVLTLRNITEGANIASATLTATTSANAAETLTLTAANADIASGDVLGIVVTNGATADTPLMWFQWEMQPQTIDAAGDLTASKIGDDAGNAYTA